MANGFTPIERRMLDLLADGMHHEPRELHACLDDELADIAAVRWHILNLRRKLPAGAEIYCVRRESRTYYRYTRLKITSRKQAGAPSPG